MLYCARFLDFFLFCIVKTWQSLQFHSDSLLVLLLFLALGFDFLCVLFALQMNRPTFLRLRLAKRDSLLILFMADESSVSAPPMI